jgi:hypothetical protein
MPKKPKDIVLVTVPNKLMSALRAYWTELDLDRGPSSTHFWDLRYGAVNRWKAGDSWPPHIHYTLMFKRGDDLDDVKHIEERGSFPPAPKTWKIVFEKGTFPEHFNPDHDRWMREHMPKIAEIEDREGSEAGWAYVLKHGPPEYLPNPENWTPEQVVAELQGIVPKAIELFESERPPIDWRPKAFIVSPPEEG